MKIEVRRENDMLSWVMPGVEVHCDYVYIESIILRG